LFRGRLGGVREYYGVFTPCFVSETAQVDMKSGRVKAPASRALRSLAFSPSSLLFLCPGGYRMAFTASLCVSRQNAMRAWKAASPKGH